MVSKRLELAARRAALGFSQESLAEAIDVSPGTVARWERGLAKPRAAQRPRLADALEVTLPELERMIANGQGSNPAPTGHPVPAWLNHYSSLEQGAGRLQVVDPITVPGLLQTEDYAGAVMRTTHEELSDGDINERVEARLARQVVFDRQPEPLEYHCVLDESVLGRVTGDTAIMAAQLDHLARISERPTVLIQIVPNESDVLHCISFGGFRMFTGSGAANPFMVCTEDFSGVRYQDNQGVLETHKSVFRHLSNSALSPTSSLDLIRARARRYANGE